MDDYCFIPVPGSRWADRSTTLLTLAILVISGLVWFYVARWYRMNKEGVDISWTFNACLAYDWSASIIA